MGKLPIINVTKTGKRYFVVNGRKIFIESKMTKKEISGIYKVLLKSVPVKKKKTKAVKQATNINKATAIIKQYINEPPKRRKRKKKSKTFKSTLNDSNRVTTSSSGDDSKKSNNEDVINSLKNQLNKEKDKPLPLIDYSVEGRILLLTQDPEYTRLSQYDNPPLADANRLLVKYDLADYYKEQMQQNRKHSQHRKSRHDVIYLDSDSSDHISKLKRRHKSSDEKEKENEPVGAKPNQGEHDPMEDVAQDIDDLEQAQAPEERKQEHKSSSSSYELDESFTDRDQKIKKPPKMPGTTDYNFAILKRVINKLHALNLNVTPIPPHATHDLEKYQKIFADEVKINEIHGADVLGAYNDAEKEYELEKNSKRGRERQKALEKKEKKKQKDEAEKKKKKEEREEKKKEKEEKKTKSQSKKRGRPKKEKPQSEDEQKKTNQIFKSIASRKPKKLFPNVSDKPVSGEGYERKSIPSDEALYDDEINKIMSRFSDFKGCIMRDQIKNLLPNIEPQSRLGFIINNQDHTKPGQHWYAVYIDARDVPESSNSLEWFDSFGRGIPPDILQDLKLVLKCLKPKTLLKVKENRVIHQKDETANCGYFCCKFLIDRFRGKSFADASGYDDRIKIDQSDHDEKEIERLKKSPPFDYI